MAAFNIGTGGQRWKKGWSTGALLPEGYGPNHSWQKDSGQVYRTCRDFYKKAFYPIFLVKLMKKRIFSFAINWKYSSPLKIYYLKTTFLTIGKIPSVEGYRNDIYIQFSVTGKILLWKCKSEEFSQVKKIFQNKTCILIHQKNS